jgi:hypothetical protein
MENFHHPQSVEVLTKERGKKNMYNNKKINQENITKTNSID